MPNLDERQKKNLMLVILELVAVVLIFLFIR